MLKFKSVNFEKQLFETYELFQKHPGQSEWIIGRSTTCDLMIDNNLVSSVHGRILYADGSYYFVDLGSLNGSFINKRELVANERERLQVGDMLQLADTYLHVEELEPLSMAALTHSFERVWTDQELTIRCCRIVEETEDVKTFHFIGEPAVIFSNYLPGQFTNLAIEIDGQKFIRSYSISSSPTRPHSISLTVKRVPRANPDVPPGLVSNWLHNHFKVGDTLQLLGGPIGRFTFLPEKPSKLLLISAGSGITPMMSMARWAYDSFADLDIIFLHSACTPEDIPFHGELRLFDECEMSIT